MNETLNGYLIFTIRKLSWIPRRSAEISGDSERSREQKRRKTEINEQKRGFCKKYKIQKKFLIGFFNFNLPGPVLTIRSFQKHTWAQEIAGKIHCFSLQLSVSYCHD